MDNVVVAFDMDRCHMELKYPQALQNMTLANLRKVFVIMCTQGYRNTEAIRVTEQYINALIVDAKEAWHKASVEYQNGYKDTKYASMSVAQKILTEKSNKALLHAVSKKKQTYERCLKMLKNFTDTKAKYKIS